ncbi:AMP-binding protein [Microbispora sp. NEAU-D428]|uniref:AMP-binding protein n=1 Tax=Microbispora sitophila TaxID=2771537 RepID=UPI001865A69C|nr:AMP-binding protein [Microbispora sitophila]MBE3013794.1 AMP-binding protein [Microbispora sitophila]
MSTDVSVPAAGLITWPPDMADAWTVVPRTTLADFAARCFGAGGDAPALIFDDGVTVSFAQLHERIERFAGFLRSRVSVGDRVALAVGNRAEYLIAYFGIVLVRGTVVTMGCDIGPADAALMIDDAGCRLAVAEGRAAEVLRGLVGETPLEEVLDVRDGEPDGLAHHYRDASRLPLTEAACEIDDLVDIGYTSGTTGMPKALGGDHAEPLRYVDVILRTRPLEADDRILVPLQYHYGDGLYLTLASWHAGVAVVVMRKFSVSRFWTVAKEFGVTQLYTIGAIPNLLLAAPPAPADRDHHIRGALAVGVPAGRHRELNERFGFPWCEMYGSSESGPALSMPDDVAQEYVGSGAIGVPYPDVQARLVDPDGVVVDGPGQGELELTGEIVFTGYLGNPDATRQVLHDGWLRTGDLARRDERGMYYFVGRVKELIRRGGQNIAPAEVEAVLRLHPAVVDAAVVPVEDDLRGEEVLAYVQVREGSSVDAAELAKFCAGRLAAFKVPRYIRLRTEPFPRTPSQRIPKNRLKVDGKHRTSGAWDRISRGVGIRLAFHELPTVVGQTFLSDWLSIDVDHIAMFEESSLVNRNPYSYEHDRYGDDLLDGFHLLSLLDHLTNPLLVVTGARVMPWNYGLDRLRFITPVRAHNRIRARGEVVEVRARTGGYLVRSSVTVELQGADRPAYVVDSLVFWQLVE